MLRRCFILLLCLCLLAGITPMMVSAADVTGTVYGLDSGSKLYVRKSASTSAEVLADLRT